MLLTCSMHVISLNSSSFFFSLKVCSDKCRHQSPEWTILSHVNCFIRERLNGCLRLALRTQEKKKTKTKYDNRHWEAPVTPLVCPSSRQMTVAGGGMIWQIETWPSSEQQARRDLSSWANLIVVTKTWQHSFIAIIHQDTAYQFPSKLVEYCRSYDEKISARF